MIPITQIKTPEVTQMAAEADAFLLSHKWCDELQDGQLAFAIAGVVGVFRFTVISSSPHVDESLWVIVGDLPPAYLVIDTSPGWQEAIGSYVHEMRRWTEAVQAGADLSDVMPVAVPPTKEHANALNSRLDFLDSQLVKVPLDSVEGDI